MGNKFRANTSNNVNSSTVQLSFALRGQFGEFNNGAVYNLPKAQDESWIPEPEHIGSNILLKLRLESEAYCFGIWLSNNCVCYSSSHSSGTRGDALSVLIKAPHPASSGELLFHKMNSLLDYFIQMVKDGKRESEIDDNKVSELIEGIREQCFSQPLPSIETPEKRSEPQPYARWEYSNEKEIGELIQLLPYQEVMSRYNIVYITKATNEASEDIPLVVDKLKKVYFFDELPSGVVVVEANPKFLLENSSFKLKYRKDDLHNPKATDFLSISMKHCRYFELVDNRIRVKEYSDSMGLVFHRPIDIIVKDEDGNELDKSIVTISYKNTIITFNKKDNNYVIEEGRSTLSIDAPGYDGEKLDIDTHDKKGVYNVTLRRCMFKKEGITLIPLWKSRKKAMQTKENVVTIEGMKKSTIDEALKDNGKFYFSRVNPLIWIVAVGIIMGGIGFTAGHFLWPKSIAHETTLDSTQTSDESYNSQQNKADQPTEKNDEETDLAYLNSNFIWKLDSLKSDKYRKFFDEIIPVKYNWTYSVTTDYPITNERWKDYMNKALDQNEGHKYKARAKEQVKTKQVNLEELIKPLEQATAAGSEKKKTDNQVADGVHVQ